MTVFSPEEWEIVQLSLKVSFAAMLFTLPLAFALAWVLARWRFPGKLLLDAAVHLPLVLPPVVIGWLLLLTLGPAGPVGSIMERWLGVTVMFRWTGAAIAAGIMALPLMVRAIRLSIEAVDHRLEEAAQTLGASPAWCFLTILLPLSLPGIAAAFILGFARSLGEFGATISFVSNIPGETRTLSLAIYSALQIPGADAVVWRLAVISICLSLGALLLSEALSRRVSADRSSHVL
ncbi:molybdate ABC transporter permease subunit [Sphingobium sp. TomTYG45]